MHKNLINWLALFHTEGIGPIKFKHYLIENPYLDNLPKIAKRTLDHSKDLIELELNWAQQDNCNIILLCDNNYPKLLKQIYDPPPILFVYGDPNLLMDPQIAIVGSRTASLTGQKTASIFATDLAKLNIITTSGLALGIDSAGHRGAIATGKGRTIAVLGNGLNLIYPRANINLAEKIILTGGTIVSEFPLNSMPNSYNFPRRNRIISGLSIATVVIEAASNSGSLITAYHAVEQGRDLFVVPGSIYDKNFKGCHSLIKRGAKLVENASDIVDDLTEWFNPNKVKNISSETLHFLDQSKTPILNHIDYEVTPTDVIMIRSGLMAKVVNAALINLELSGFIRHVPGGYIKLI